MSSSSRTERTPLLLGSAASSTTTTTTDDAITVAVSSVTRPPHMLAAGRVTVASPHSSLVFHNVSCRISTSSWLSCLKKGEGEREGERAPAVIDVLSGVSGEAKAGSVLAIMGPSGSGKTSLLDILAGRKNIGELSGSLTLDSQEISFDALQGVAGYVTQDDILLSTLTVFETLDYALQLRSRKNKSERRIVIDSVLDALHLTSVRNSRVGGEMVRGISGGERRRLSIGLELVVDKSILFLDEPTSGLDSHAAQVCMENLHDLARQRNAIVVCSIHQPRSSIFALLDDVLLLSKGLVVYGGPNSQIKSWLISIERPLPEAFNMADFLLDLVGNEDPAITKLLNSSSSSNNNNSNKGITVHATSSSATYNNNSNRNGSYAHHVANGNGSINRGVHADESSLALHRPKPVSFFRQMSVLIRRNTTHMVRDPLILLQQLLQYIGCAIFTGLLFSNLKNNIPEQKTLGLNFGIDCFSVFSFFAVPTYMQNRQIFNRERSAGYYSTHSYFLANFLILLPVSFLLCLGYTLVLFKLQKWEGNVWFSYLVNMLVMHTFLAINEFIGAAIKSIQIALGIAGFANVMSMVFAGVMCIYPNIPVYLRWLYWGSPMSYAMTAVLHNEFSGSDEGQMYLDSFGAPLENDTWTCVFALAGFTAGLRLACYLALVFLQKEKR